MKTTLVRKAAAAALAAATLASAAAISAFAAQKDEVAKELLSTSEYLLSQNPDASYLNDYALGAIVSGAADESFKESYRQSVEDALKQNDGKLMYTDAYTGESAESLMYEATAAIVLNKMGFDTSDIGGYDLNEAIASFNITLVDNPYHLCEAIKAARAIGADEEVISTLTDAIMAYYSDDGEIGGMDYWGISTDNNGVFIEALAPYMDLDDNIKTAVEKSLKFIENMKRADGYDSSVAYASEYGNADSTALALRAFIAVNDTEKADEAYNYLLGFKSFEVDGAYLYSGFESVYAAKDAQSALLAYYDYISANDQGELTTESPTDTTDTTNTDGEQALDNTTEATQESTADNTDAKPDATQPSESTTTQSIDTNPNTGAGAKSLAISTAVLSFIGVLVSRKRR